MAGTKTCAVDGCDRRRHGESGWCGAHRWRVQVLGDLFVHLPIGRMRNGALIGRDPADVADVADAEVPADVEDVGQIAYAPTPAEGHGLLWLL